MLRDRIGLAKYYFNVGKEYAELLRGSLTPTLLAGFVTHQGGGSVSTSFLTAALVPVGFIVAGLVMGKVIVHWRIVHRTIEHEWENNPVTKKQIELSTEIRDELRLLNAILRTEQAAVAEPDANGQPVVPSW
jgi:hypothetical protein